MKKLILAILAVFSIFSFELLPAPKKMLVQGIFNGLRRVFAKAAQAKTFQAGARGYKAIAETRAFQVGMKIANVCLAVDLLLYEPFILHSYARNEFYADLGGKDSKRKITGWHPLMFNYG